MAEHDMDSIPPHRDMVVYSPGRPNPTPWMSRPAEIRLMILEAIADQKHPGWASLASVCKEWQSVLEKRNFRRLKLRRRCLAGFERMTIRPRHLIRHVWLDIELPRYTCQDFQTGESSVTRSRNTSITTTGICRLFSILSTWNPGNNGLTLELSTHSPSDSDHWFKNYIFASDEENLGGATASMEGHDSSRRWHDPKHGWVDGQQVRRPPKGSLLRLFSRNNPLLKERISLPRVNAVTHFIIRRQLRRQILPDDLTVMVGSLRSLESLVYEPWRPLGGLAAFRVAIGYVFWVEHVFPANIKSILVFEDFDDDLTEAWHGHLPENSSALYCAKISEYFAAGSLDLEKLAVSYKVEAEAFFQACTSADTWRRLRSLALTSQLLRSEGDRQRINALLCRAGTTALRMPVLHTLVLWNSTKVEACAFIYRKEQDRPHVTWRGTWELELSSNAVEVWQRVASQSRPWELDIEKQKIDAAVIKSHADAIYHLKLPCQVVSSASLWQMRRERAHLNQG